MDLRLKKGQQVVKVLTIQGIPTATVHTVRSVRKGVVSLEDYEGKFDAHGHELEPSYMGSNRLIVMGG